MCHEVIEGQAAFHPKKERTWGTDSSLKVRTVRWVFHSAASAAGYSLCSCEGSDLLKGFSWLI